MDVNAVEDDVRTRDAHLRGWIDADERSQREGRIGSDCGQLALQGGVAGLQGRDLGSQRIQLLLNALEGSGGNQGFRSALSTGVESGNKRCKGNCGNGDELAV